MLAIREGGQTIRCHTLPYIGPYNVAIHSYNALSLLLLLRPASSLNLIKAILWHDIPERWTGDVPTPAKMADPILRAAMENLEAKVLESLGLGDIFNCLTEEELQWLSAIDLLELYIWSIEQESLGNKLVADLSDRVLKIVDERDGKIPDKVRDVFRQLYWEYSGIKRSPDCDELLKGGVNGKRS